MAMTERAYAYEEAQSYELRRMHVLDGTAAREKANKRRGDAVKLAVSVAAILVYLLGITFMQAKISSAGHEINEIKAAIAETETLSAHADLQIGKSSSLNYIEAYASTELGMVYPAADNVYFLDEESSYTIASARNQVVAAEEEQPADEEHPLWKNIGAAFENFFLGQALAAGGSE
jgi:cell division protein FtsL